MTAKCLLLLLMAVLRLRSPHVTSVTERIAVGGAPIPQTDFDRLVQTHSHAVQHVQRDSGGALSYFEALTGLACKFFEEQKVGKSVRA